jgi:O-methyltransferase involved in polyketide biosynthesis
MDVDAASSFTAETMALQRAFESHRPSRSRLFSDPHADAFLRPRMRWMAASDLSTKDAGRQLFGNLHRTERGSALYRVVVADIKSHTGPACTTNLP